MHCQVLGQVLSAGSTLSFRLPVSSCQLRVASFAGVALTVQ